MTLRLERSRAVSFLPALTTLAFAASVLPSVPALRQDWGPYPFGEGAADVFWTGTSGWRLIGIGTPMPYPQAYLVAPSIALLRLVLGAEGALVAFMLVVGALCAYGGRSLARALGSGEIGASAAALFLTFNPWTFTELVAGHSYMLLGYAATVCLAAEILRRQPRPAVLILCLLAATPQIQFLLLDSIAVVIVAWRRRLPIPIAIAILLWLPSIIGIVAERGALSATPFELSWEANQSVTPLGALVLNGYFAHYGDQFSGLRSIPVTGIALLAAYGFVAMRKQRATVIIGALTLLFLAAAMGARGPFAPLFSWSVLHVPALGVFRELYDLLGYVVIGYTVGALAARGRIASWAFVAAAGVLTVLWWWQPPWHLWVPSSRVPAVAVTAPRNTRFALVPEFQPLSFDGHGSGTDPDFSVRGDNVTPLNQYLATYPANAALGAFAKTGDVQALRALSVSVVIVRPYLTSARDALEQQWALPLPAPRRAGGSETLALQPMPELSLITTPAIGTVDDRMGAGNIFFGDVEERAFEPVSGTSSTIDARRAWVDARLAFAERPELAQGFGGALTTDPHALLHLRGGRQALVWVHGTLRSRSGTVLSRTTHGYAWIAVPADTSAVFCSGLCVVAGQGAPPRLPQNPAPRAYRGIDFSMVAPWLVRATVPAGARGALRYNVAYDAAWAAFLNGKALRHVRLDVTVNGWLLPPRAKSATIVIVDRVAAAQAAAELFVGCVLLALAASRVRVMMSR